VRKVLVLAAGAQGSALFLFVEVLEGSLVLFLGLEEVRLRKWVEAEKFCFVRLGEIGGLKVFAACLVKDKKQKGDQHQRKGVRSDDATDLGGEEGGITDGTGGEGSTLVGRRSWIPIDVEGVRSPEGCTGRRHGGAEREDKTRGNREAKQHRLVIRRRAVGHDDEAGVLGPGGA